MGKTILKGILFPKKTTELIDIDRNDIPRNRYFLKTSKNPYKKDKTDSLDAGFVGLLSSESIG